MRKSADSSVDFVESSLLTLPLTIAALAVCGVAFSLYGRIPAALFSLGLAAVAAGSRLWARRALDEVSASPGTPAASASRCPTASGCP